MPLVGLSRSSAWSEEWLERWRRDPERRWFFPDNESKNGDPTRAQSLLNRPMPLKRLLVAKRALYRYLGVDAAWADAYGSNSARHVPAEAGIVGLASMEERASLGGWVGCPLREIKVEIRLEQGAGRQGRRRVSGMPVHYAAEAAVAAVATIFETLMEVMRRYVEACGPSGPPVHQGAWAHFVAAAPAIAASLRLEGRL